MDRIRDSQPEDPQKDYAEQLMTLVLRYEYGIATLHPTDLPPRPAADG
jgi:hypothetical protein